MNRSKRFNCLVSNLVAVARRLLRMEVRARPKPPKIDIGNYLKSHRHLAVVPNDAIKSGGRHSVQTDTKYASDFQAITNAAQSLAQAARHSHEVGAYRQSLLGAIELLDLANLTQNGGIVEDFLIAMSQAGSGSRQICSLRNFLDSSDRLHLIAEMRRIEREREPIEVIQARDRKWVAENLCSGKRANEPVPCQYRHLTDPAEFGMTQAEMDEIFDAMEEFANVPDESREWLHASLARQHIATMRMLSIDAALRDFSFTRGFFPENLAQLSPVWFDIVPSDPFTGQAFKYRVTEFGFALYSPGPTQVDHGGKVGNLIEITLGEADLLLDNYLID